MTQSDADQSAYIIDASDGTEMARLIDQDLTITQTTGVFPASLDLTEVYRLLDVACGPGGWAREAARQLPDTTIIGGDLNDEMLRYARAFASVQRLHNLSFQHLDVRQPFAFADGSFDLLHARLLVAVVPRSHWPALLREYARLLRAGGWIVLTEGDRPFPSNSPALERWTDLLMQAMVQTGFYAGTSGEGLTPRLPALLHAAGFEAIEVEHHHLDISYGTPHYAATVNNIQMSVPLVQPFLLKMGLSSAEALDTLFEHIQRDLLAPSFQGQMNLTRVWGHTPAS